MLLSLSFNHRGLSIKTSYSRGLTLLELVVTLAIISILAIASGTSYRHYIEATETNIAIKDVMAMQLSINAFALNNEGDFPSNLSEVGLDGYEDPWGNTYQYLNIAQGNNIGKARKDRNLVPINSDYDLYSKGPDEKSVSPLTAEPSKDDIVRGNNGSFVGVAEDY